MVYPGVGGCTRQASTGQYRQGSTPGYTSHFLTAGRRITLRKTILDYFLDHFWEASGPGFAYNRLKTTIIPVPLSDTQNRHFLTQFRHFLTFSPLLQLSQA